MPVKIPPDVERELETIRRTVMPRMLPLFCLALINKKPRCGYDIIKENKRITDEVISLPTKKKYVSPALIYPLLHKLEKEGLLKSKWSERRKIYHITSKGKKHLEIGRKLWKESINAQMRLYEKMFKGDKK